MTKTNRRYQMPTSSDLALKSGLSAKLKELWSNAQENSFELFLYAAALRERYLDKKTQEYSAEFRDWYAKQEIQQLFGKLPAFTKYAMAGNVVNFFANDFRDGKYVNQLPLSRSALYEISLLRDQISAADLEKLLFTGGTDDEALISPSASASDISAHRFRLQNKGSKPTKSKTKKFNIPLATIYVSRDLYKFFHPATETQFPFKVNTRIYSCLLIDNACPYRWRGRYNEDTILSLDVLKDVRRNPTHEDLNAVNEDGSLKNPKDKRLATIEFVAFLQDKLKTQTLKGGNTAEFYQKEGTAAKSAMLVDIHPDVATTADMFNRDHHKVQYEVFRSNWLIRTDERKAELKARNWKPLKNENPYGMRLVERPK